MDKEGDEGEMQPVFIKINGDIFNVNKIQSIQFEDQMNCLGNNSGVYILHIYMENNIGSVHKAYSEKKQRDEDFLKAQKKLTQFGIGKVLKEEKADE